MIYFYAFFQIKCTIFNVFMHYQCDVQVQIPVMDLTLIGDRTLSNTLLLERNLWR